MPSFPKEIFGLNGIVILTALLLLAGGGLLFGIWLAAKKKPAREHEMWFHFLRDLGIAFLVAAIVALVVDSVLNFRRLSDLFAIVYGSDVGEAVVETVRPTVFQRDYMRENADIIVRLLHDDKLPADQAVIKVEIGYDVYSLKAFGDPNYQFQQELEHYNIRGKGGDGKELPRFDVVSVSTRERPYEGEELQKMVKDGRLTIADKIALKPWPKDETSAGAREKSAVRITVRRTEIVYVPGSYTIVVAELTKGVRVRVTEYPDDVCVEIKRWYQSKAYEFDNAAKDEKYNPGVILPGQSISLRFWKKSECPDGNNNAAAPSQTPAQTPTPAPQQSAAVAAGGKRGRTRQRRGRRIRRARALRRAEV